MKVRYYPCRANCYGNLMFEGRAHPMRYGALPKSQEQHKSDDPLGRFRALGYLASCFPEGDGIAFAPPAGKTSEQVIADVIACFGWEVANG